MAPAASIFATRTTTQLLDALRDPSNQIVWGHVDGRYRPVVASLARRLGLDQADADEVAQQTLAEFYRAYRDGRYDRARGRLSSWILGIAHHSTRRLQRQRKGGGATPNDAIDEAPDAAADATLRQVWEEERDRAILSQALGILRDDSSIEDKTLLAFELVGLRGVPAAQAAQECAMPVEQVYVAKSRVTKRLRELVKQLTDAFEEDL